jgi:hypothetical protein
MIIHNRTEDNTRRIKIIEIGSNDSRTIEVKIKEVPQKNIVITKII